MGLFDAYYDPQTYAPAQGGLIDRLLAGLNAQSPYQPGAGFPPSTMGANAAMPAPAPHWRPEARRRNV